MSSVAKVFVVLNLILGVAAFGAAGALLGAQDDYKSALERVNEEFAGTKEEYDKDVARLESELTQQIQRASTAVSEQQKAQNDLTDRSNRLNQAETTISQLNSTIEKFSQELATANQVNQSNKEFLDRLTAESRQATADANQARQALQDEIQNRVNLEQQVSNANEQVQQQAATIGDLERRMRELEFENTQYRSQYGPIVAPTMGAPGRVIGVKDNLVQISVGSDDKVRVGDRYGLSRGGSFVGFIKIENVTKDTAVGTFDTQYPGPGAPPQVNDKATPSPR